MKTKTKLITKSALFAALIYVATLTGAVCPIGGGAYLHIGDAMVYSSALVLPFPFAMLSSAVGGMLADITLGSAVYAVPTMIIKALTALAVFMLLKITKKPVLSDALACLAGVVTVVGYFVAESIMYAFSAADGISAAIATAAAGMPYNCLQALASAVVFMIIAPYIKKIK